MIAIDYGELKLKLVASIVAISAIKLLEAFMNIDHESNRDLAWQTGIFGAFVGAALLLGIAEAVGRAYGDHSREPPWTPRCSRRFSALAARRSARCRRSARPG